MPPRFRTSFTHQQGFEDAVVFQGKVVNVNLVNWTVDCVSTFDHKRVFDVQVASPYLHYSTGEGIYAVPEIGAKVMICIPGDSTAPFVMGFVAPLEVTSGGGKETDASQLETEGASGSSQNPNGAKFSAGRMDAKPGDIVMKGRDGNFVILHRGGVLQVGAGPVSQRLFIPIENLIEDISGRYSHYSTGGSILWGMRENASDTNPPCEYQENFRVFANDKYADIRISKGNVYDPVGGDESTNVGSSVPLVVEVCVARDAFDPHTGEPNKSAQANTKFRYILDRDGNMSLRVEGNAHFNFKKKFTMTVKDQMTLRGSTLDASFSSSVTLESVGLVDINGDKVRLGKGSQPVARMGDVVKMVPGAVPITGSMVVGGVPTPFTAVMTITTPLMGVIDGPCNPKVLA